MRARSRAVKNLVEGKMDAKILIEKLKASGVEISLRGDKIRLESSRTLTRKISKLLGQVQRQRQEVRALLAPPCYNCGAKMDETVDTLGRRWKTCWQCAARV